MAAASSTSVALVVPPALELDLELELEADESLQPLLLRRRPVLFLGRRRLHLSVSFLPLLPFLP
jgi:hypothetical protein